MKLLAKTIFLAFLVSFYIFIINISFNILIYSSVDNSIGYKINSFEEYGTSVDISSSISFNPVVERPRFFGTFYEFYYSTYTYSYLLLFNLIKIPLSVDAFSYLLIHLFMILFIVLFILIL